ncbi:MAG: 6-bladed beta-propeller [Balneolaceae bacterium]|nr:6-bladed beta-propeller [Balneolaceae bacterium]
MLLWWLPVVIFACSSENQPDYISSLPEVESFSYSAFTDTLLSSKKVDIIPELFISGRDSERYTLGMPFWIEKVEDEIWISDPVRGEIAAFDEGGQFLKMIATKGNGPGELLNPASISYQPSISEVKDDVWILDSGSKNIIQYSIRDGEVNRSQNKYLNSAFFGNKLLRLNNGKLLAPLLNHERHVLGIFDQSGELVESLIDRLVPLGFQPTTYNHVYFDFEPSQNKLVYTYHGLPLIFMQDMKQERRQIFDFMPDKQLIEYNIDLKPIPMNERVSVNSMINDLFISDNLILFYLENDLIIFDYFKKEIQQVITWVDNEGFPMVFQQMVFTDGTFFLINRFTSDIYKFELSEIQG